MAVNTGKIQGKHREFNLNLNVATLVYVLCKGCERENKQTLSNLMILICWPSGRKFAIRCYLRYIILSVNRMFASQYIQKEFQIYTIGKTICVKML